jgi:membrane dipeptidase
MTPSDLSARGRALIAESIVIAGHTDYIADLGPRRRRGERGVMRRHLPALRAGGVTAVCDHVGGDAPYYAVYPANAVSSAAPLKHALQALQHVKDEIAESADLMLALTAEDIRRAHATGKVAVILCLEGAAPIEDDISLLRILYDLGIRCIGLTHNQRNLLADGIAVHAGGGLTDFGRKAVSEMERLGIAVDVSHLSAEGFWSLVDVATRPITASHSNAHAINPHPRNLTDDQIRAIAASGGAIGVHGMSLLVNGTSNATLADVIAHIDHMAALVGPQYVAVGPDIMPDWDATTYREVWSASADLSSLTFTYPPDFDGLDKMGNLATGLLQRGYADGDVAGILGGNWLRVLGAIWDGTDVRSESETATAATAMGRAAS